MSSFLLLALTAGAQTPSNIPPQKNAPPQQVLPPAQLTELEQTKLQLDITQNMLLHKTETSSDIIRISLLFNAAHPGYQYKEQTQSLVPIPQSPTNFPKPEAKK